MSSKVSCLHDPSGLYPRGHWWYSMAFMETLRAGMWPPGMQVLMDGQPAHIRVVRGNEETWSQATLDQEELQPQRLEPLEESGDK